MANATSVEVRRTDNGWDIAKNGVAVKRIRKDGDVFRVRYVKEKVDSPCAYASLTGAIMRELYDLADELA